MHHQSRQTVLILMPLPVPLRSEGLSHRMHLYEGSTIKCDNDGCKYLHSRWESILSHLAHESLSSLEATSLPQFSISLQQTSLGSEKISRVCYKADAKHMEELVTRRDWACDSQVLIFISCDKKQNPHRHSPPSAPLSTGIVPQSHTEQASRKPLSSTGSSSSLMVIFNEYDDKWNDNY